MPTPTKIKPVVVVETVIGKLTSAITSHVMQGDQHHKQAGELLLRLQNEFKRSAEFFEHVQKHVGIGRSRAFELMSIAKGKKTVEQVRASSAKRQARHQDKRKVAAQKVAKESVTNGLTKVPSKPVAKDPPPLAIICENIEALPADFKLRRRQMLTCG
jgi:hypothetical protein